MSGDTSQAILADGLTEGVTTGLVRVEGLRVVSARTHRVQELGADPLEVGRALGVDIVLVATVRILENRVRVTPQLVDVGTGQALWQEQFDGDLLADGRVADLFTIQDAITSRIVHALQLRLSPASAAALARGAPTRDPEAYRLYLEARRAGETLTQEGAERAVVLLERALTRDSSFADVWAALADALALRSDFTLPTAASRALARRATTRALELDSLNGRALAQRASARMYEWDWDGAREDMRRALAVAPGSGAAHGAYAYLLVWLGEPESSLAHGRIAFELSERRPLDMADLAASMLLAGRKDSARILAERAVTLDSTTHYAYYHLAHLHLDAGRPREAEHAAERHFPYVIHTDWGMAGAAHYYRKAGDTARCRDLLERITAMAARRPVSPSSLAVVRLAAGDRAGALDALEEAARVQDPLIMLNLTRLEALRGEPRFEAVSRTVYGGRPRPVFPI